VIGGILATTRTSCNCEPHRSDWLGHGEPTLLWNQISLIEGCERTRLLYITIKKRILG
jgi:hypothetical protein